MKAMCIKFNSLIIKSLVFIAIGIAACGRGEFNPNEDDVISVEMEDGTSLLEDEKKDAENGYVNLIFDVNENSFYFRGHAQNVGPSIGKIENNEINWIKKEATHASLVIKSENEGLNNSLLITNIGTSSEWMVRIYKNNSNHVIEKRFAPPFANSNIYDIYQLENTPKKILNQYKNLGVDINNIKSDYEIFCILGSINRITPFFYFFAISYDQSSSQIIPLPNFIKADSYKLTTTSENFFILETIASEAHNSEVIIKPSNCATLEKTNSNITQLFLSGQRNSLLHAKPLFSRVSIELNSELDINTENCSLQNATFNYDVNLDWVTELPFGEGTSIQSSKDKVIMIDTTENKYDIYAIGHPSSLNYAWIAALDYDGKLKWQKQYYGVNGKIEFKTLLLDDQYVIVGGNTGFEYNIAKQFGYIGLFDKLNGNILSQKKYGIANENLTISAIRREGDYINAWGIQRNSIGWSFKIKKSNL